MDNTFYLLSKTNKEGLGSQSNSSNVPTRKGESKYDQLVEDFNQLLDGKEIKYEEVQNKTGAFTPQHKPVIQQNPRDQSKHA